MSEVTFDEDQNNVVPVRTVERPRPPVGGIIGWMMVRGWARTPLMANLILVGVALACFAITGWLLSGATRDFEITPAQQRMNEWMALGGTGAPPETFKPELR